ncbi:MAG TPA: integrase family protein [Stellaceae bacterium]|nr:integrase family protein [Stellaceae bacterium]
MPVITLTDLALRNLKTEGRATYFDAALRGFAVRVTSNGAKTFVIVHGKERDRKWESIGRYDPNHLTLAKARKVAGDRLAQIRLGLRDDAPSLTFEEAFALFKQTHTSQKNRVRTARDTERLILKHLVPKLGRKGISEIATHDVMQLIDKLLPTPGTCIHVFAAARLMFRWAAQRRIVARSPLDGVPPPAHATARERTLTDNELREVLTKTIADGSTFAKIVQLLIITGQRRSQIAALRGEYVQTDVLHWPTDAMKKRQHSIPLTPMAQALLVEAPKEGYVFLARGSDSPFNGFSKCKIAFDKQLDGVAPWTLHDLRRTFSTGLARLRVPPHIKEMLLSHASAKDPVEAIYDRYNYMEEQREALLKWEAKLQTLLSKPED